MGDALAAVCRRGNGIEGNLSLAAVTYVGVSQAPVDDAVCGVKEPGYGAARGLAIPLAGRRSQAPAEDERWPRLLAWDAMFKWYSPSRNSFDAMLAAAYSLSTIERVTIIKYQSSSTLKFATTNSRRHADEQYDDENREPGIVTASGFSSFLRRLIAPRPKLAKGEVLVMDDACALVKGWRTYEANVYITSHRLLIEPVGTKRRRISRVFIPFDVAPEALSIPWHEVRNVENVGPPRIAKWLRELVFTVVTERDKQEVKIIVARAGPIKAAVEFQREQAARARGPSLRSVVDETIDFHA